MENIKIVICKHTGKEVLAQYLENYKEELEDLRAQWNNQKHKRVAVLMNKAKSYNKMQKEEVL